MMTVFEELKRRGLIAQMTDEAEIAELIDAGKATFYIGFDPTADSLHVGHFMALCLMKRLQMAGNKPIILIGGGTAMIGDPSGKTDMRKMMTKETIQHNVDCFKKQMSRFIDFSEDKAIIVNNADWLLNLNYVDVLREVGAHFSVNRMLTHECYKQRMERGLTFLEFNYMIMQSYDFYKLFQDYGCNMQFGGDDQWANMLGGTELIRRKLGKDAYAMTITLLLNSEGKKMGKTEKGAVWLDAEKTTPYEFYQYWRNVSDQDVIKCLKLLTFVPIEQIEEMERTLEGQQLNQAKELLAYSLTELVHGKDAAEQAQTTAKAVFTGDGSSENMPTTAIPAADLQDGCMGILTLMVRAGLSASNGEARRLVQQGGVTVNDVKVTDDSYKSQVDYILEQSATYKDTKSAKISSVDKVKVDYTGQIKYKGKKVTFEGGTASDQEIDLGNNSSGYIDGFTKALEGQHKVGDKFTKKLKFPDTYKNNTKIDGKEVKLAGKTVWFTFTIKSISTKSVPKLTDKFVKEKFGAYGVTDVKSFEKYAREQMRISNIMNKVWSNFVASCEVVSYSSTDISPSMRHAFSSVFLSSNVRTPFMFL